MQNNRQEDGKWGSPQALQTHSIFQETSSRQVNLHKIRARRRASVARFNSELALMVEGQGFQLNLNRETNYKKLSFTDIKNIAQLILAGLNRFMLRTATLGRYTSSESHCFTLHSKLYETLVQVHPWTDTTSQHGKVVHGLGNFTISLTVTSQFLPSLTNIKNVPCK